MNDKLTVEEAADQLEAIARSRRAKDAVLEIAGRVVIADRLEKASGLDGLRELAESKVAAAAPEPMSGASVLRALREMTRDQE